MSSDYIPRLRHELLRAGASQPARWRRPARPLRPLAVAAAVALIVAAVVLALPGTGTAPDLTPSGELSRLDYRVDPAHAAAAAQTMRARLAALGIEDTRVSVTPGAGLTIVAPAAARADVTALTQRGVLAIYDWEHSVLGPQGRPEPTDASVTGGIDAGRAAAITKSEAEARSGRPVQGETGAGWFALGGAPALTNADIQSADPAVDPTTKSPVVTVELTAHGQTAFTTLTRDLAHRGSARAADGITDEEARQHFVIAIDDRIVGAPYIDHRQAPDGIDGAGGAHISGGLTAQRARQLAAILSTGPLPATLSPVDG